MYAPPHSSCPISDGRGVLALRGHHPARWRGPARVQHREDESFYVLEGEYEFLDDGGTTRAGAGSLIYVPRGNLHAHKDVGTTIGRLLVSQTPGGLNERFFEELGEEAWDKTKPPAPEGPPDVEKVGATAVEYGIEIPPPPEGQSDKRA